MDRLPRLRPFQRFVVRHHESRWLMAATSVVAPRRLFRSFMALARREPLPWLRGRAALTLSFDCDFTKDVEAFPAVTRLLADRGLRASFAVVGLWAERHPDLHRALADAGHELLNHTWTHPDNPEIDPDRKFRHLPRAEKREELERAHEIIARTTGVECVGCRIPHFKDLFTPEIYGLLAELGYRFDSSTLMTGVPGGGRPFRAEAGIWEFPLTTCPRHPLTVLDTWHSLHADHPFYRLSHQGQAAFCALLWEAIETALETGGWVNVYLDPWDVPALADLPGVLARVAERAGELEVLVYEEILERLEGRGAPEAAREAAGTGDAPAGRGAGGPGGAR